MSRELYCPKCSQEYWGEYEEAKCSCGYTFTKEEKDIVLGYDQSINDNVIYLNVRGNNYGRIKDIRQR